MKILIKFSPEITIKSRSVRIFFVKILVNNLKNIFKKHGIIISIVRYWDYLEIKYCTDDLYHICLLLRYIPGIHKFFLAHKNNFSSLEEIYQKMIHIIDFKLTGKSFCVRVKRSGNHIFNSQDVECFLGEKICQNIKNTCVDLIAPAEIVSLEIKDDCFFVITKNFQGLGGLPIGTQGELLSLISGGFDSAVSSYMLIRRGCKVHYCFFHFFENMKYIESAYKVAYYLWSQFGSSHKVKFIAVNFTEIVKEIISKVHHDSHIGIILKRMMIRVASMIASYNKIEALVTGEALGQVSSQTLDNLQLINNVTSCMILRPLIAYDKQKIIDISRDIGTEFFSKNAFEYCGLFSKKSTIKTDVKSISISENDFDFTILDRSVSQSYSMDVRKIPEKISNQFFFKIDIKEKLEKNDIVIDIRTENEQETSPLFLSDIKVLKIPFYYLLEQFSKLDKKKLYFLYCSHGIMSRLQVVDLYKQGFYNVKIYRPKKIG